MGTIVMTSYLCELVLDRIILGVIQFIPQIPPVLTHHLTLRKKQKGNRKAEVH